MILTKFILDSSDNENVIIPNSNSFVLPERVLQFGTGVLLRGLPDYFIDKANRNGVFNGRVVVVKSTSKGDLSDFRRQDNLYTICVRGIEKGQNIEQNIVSSAISRVLSAESEWEEILQVARNPTVQIYLSNTTEVGIVLKKESIFQTPPVSFPAKLLAALYARYQANGEEEFADVIVIATELIPNNGSKLAEIVAELIKFNELDNEFVNWFHLHVQFCNSLVDRIVPGKPEKNILEAIQQDLGYEDTLLIMAEPYRLWAIEGNEKVSTMLDLEAIDSGIIIKQDIEIYRELKVRLLNGSHTLASGIAYLSGIETVASAMENHKLRAYITNLMQREIIPAIPYDIPGSEAQDFSASVLDRFANPYIEHLWINITFQYTMKLRIRILPLLIKHYQLSSNVPVFIAAGFGAYLRFMRVVEKTDDKYYGEFNGKKYPITDDSAEYYLERSRDSADNFVRTVLSDVDFWGLNFSELNGFIEEVDKNYRYISDNGVIATPD